MVCLKGKIAIITGASSGIGKATAIHFASLGCNLTLTGRNEENLAKVARECRNKAGSEELRVLIVPGDINDDETVSEIVRKTVEYFGKIDILVNNAGIADFSFFQDIDMEKAKAVFETNFWAQIKINKLVIPYLKETKGNIVNVSSVASEVKHEMTMVYGASKCALDYLTKNLALSLGADGVRVNSVNPAVIDTPIFERLNIPKKAHLEKHAPSHALLRVGQPEEVAKPIAFLASDDASFITGAILLVDGGLEIKRAP